LADGIYPTSQLFVKAIAEPQGQEACDYTQGQEALRKDAERGFGVLKARFGILGHPMRLWHYKTILIVLYACVILHNMRVETNRGAAEDGGDQCAVCDDCSTGSHTPHEPPATLSLAAFLALHQKLRKEANVVALRNALRQHVHQKARLLRSTRSRPNLG
jgi:hypothetical protein